MTEPTNKLELENDPETFTKLIQLCSFYSKTFQHYQKILSVLNNLPRHEGRIVLEADAFMVIKECLDNYPAINAYTQKMMAKEITLH